MQRNYEVKHLHRNYKALRASSESTARAPVHVVLHAAAVEDVHAAEASRAGGKRLHLRAGPSGPREGVLARAGSDFDG